MYPYIKAGENTYISKQQRVKYSLFNVYLDVFGKSVVLENVLGL